MSNHAILSASSAHRWLACPPSALLNAKEPDETSEYALQGTEARTLCKHYLNKILGMNTSLPELKFYDQEMEESAKSYVEFMIQELAKAQANCKDPLILVEQKLDFSCFVPDGFGTVDCLIIAEKELSVIDFKYGMGVQVEAENNPQMMCYALGALLLFDEIYDIETVKMTIFQPRKEHVSSWSISKEDLQDWAVNILQPTAEIAAKGEGEFCAGDHCRFCKIKARCRKRAEYSLEMAKYDFKPIPELEDIEVEAILERTEHMISWINDVKDYALGRALQGKKWEDRKLVDGRSVRKYKDEAKVVEIVEEEGYNPYSRKLIGITEMTKLLGKEKFKELLRDQIIKPKGKPTLVPYTDKRKEMNVAASDFGGE